MFAKWRRSARHSAGLREQETGTAIAGKGAFVDFNRLIIAHGVCIAVDAKKFVKKAFRWLAR